ncbi:glycosyltransferase family 1 protein [Gammaproteobacteria bacterium AS21]
MKKIKILVDAHVLDGKYQGTSSYIAGLYSAIAKTGQCELYAATEKEASMQKYFNGVSNINWVPLKASGKFTRLSTEFDRISKAVKPDYSHFQYITPLIKREKWINTIHDVLFLDFPQEFPLKYRLQNHALFRLSALRSDVLTTVSDYSRYRISHHFNLKKENIIVTPNAVDDISKVTGEAIKNLIGVDFFVFVSRLEPRKNQHALVEAFLKAKLPAETKLILVGAPALEYNDLTERLNNEKASERVIHLQGISQNELVWLYQNARASVYPSKCEGFGIPPLEAAVLGTKSYCADNTALSELSPYLDGLFDANNTDEIVSVLERSYHDNETTIKKSPSDDYQWSKSAEILLQRLLT